MSGVLAASAAVSAGLSAYKIGQGISTKKKGEKLENSLERYEYKTPSEILENRDLAKINANEGINAAQKNEFNENTALNATNILTNASSRKAGLVGAEIAGQQTAQANRELRIADTKKRLENMKQLMLSNSIVADYKDKEFQLNEIDPYEDKLNYARSMQSAGQQSINNGIDSLASSGNSFLQSYASTQ